MQQDIRKEAVLRAADKLATKGTPPKQALFDALEDMEREQKRDLWMAGVAVLLGLVTMGLNPLVASDLWGWFLVPLGVPPVGYWHAWGLMTLMFFLRHMGTVNDPNKYKGNARTQLVRAAGGLLGTCISWGFGWLLLQGVG